MMEFAAGVSAWWAHTLPLLPSMPLQLLYLHGAWAVVLASGVWMGLRRFSAARGMVFRWSFTHAITLTITLSIALYALWPGPYALSYWLGLAFQNLSISAVGAALAGVYLTERSAHASVSKMHAPALYYGVALGLVLGWLLLLDTFAVLPLELYAFGFSPAASGVLMALALVPWLWRSEPRQAPIADPIANSIAAPVAVAIGLVPAMAVGVFVVLRLPSGNAWDAVLDPWLWLALHAVAIRWLWRSMRKRRE